MTVPKFFKQWLPETLEAMEPWRTEVRQKAADPNMEILPVIQKFRELVADDPIIRMNMTRMIEQIPADKKSYHPRSIEELLLWLNYVLRTAPTFNETAAVGTPFSAVLMWTMGTSAGFEAYRYEKLNAMFKELLADWTRFLNSSGSCYVLNSGPTGWQSPAALKKLDMRDYQYKPTTKYWGFTSWNAFFTRKLAPGARPIHEPENSKVIVSACDSQVYSIETKVARSSKFWLKTQPHSLDDMLGRARSYGSVFEGGTVLQAFLNPFNYHRWHSPVAGTVKEAFVQEGLYFSQANSEGEDPTIQDHSEGYITQVQTRAIIIIEADDPVIGTVCVIPVGMVEISSCIIGTKIVPGAHVTKGEELGYFQFGGSTHCVLFRPGAIKEMVLKVDSIVQVGQPVAIAN